MSRLLRRRVRLCAFVLCAALLLVVTGCSQTKGGAEGFISGGGTVTVLGAADRKTAPQMSGSSLQGEPLSLADYRGQVVVVNVWGSWCAPCRAEASELVAAARELAQQDVRFLGVNVRDTKARARAFVRNFDIPYPSIHDQDGSTLLGFRDTLPPDSIPSTLVIDREGRVAARVLGEVTKTTLTDLVDEVAGES